MNDLVDMVKSVCGGNVFPVFYEFEDGIFLSVNGHEYMFMPLVSEDWPTNEYVIFQKRPSFSSYDALPGISTGDLFSELNRVCDVIDDILKFSTGYERDVRGGSPSVRLRQFDDLILGASMFFYFEECGLRKPRASINLVFNIDSKKFKLNVFYSAGGYTKIGADFFVEHLYTELILKPLGKTKMEDVTDEDRDVLQMMNYG